VSFNPFRLWLDGFTDVHDSPESASADETSAPEPQSAVSQQSHEPVSAISNPSAQSATLSNGTSLFQQSLPQQQQAQQQPQAQQHSLPSAISQSVQTQAPTQTQSQAATSPIPPFGHQAGLSTHQQQQQSQQTHQQYAQHGLPTHIDPTQSQGQQQQPQHPSPQQQQQMSQAQQAQHAQQQAQQQGVASYFRQPEAPYFHPATPPAGQGPENSFGAFAQLGHGIGQVQQHQGQQTHLGGFGADYGYGDGQRVRISFDISSMVADFCYRDSTNRTVNISPMETGMFWATTM
jgi:hypothetical protein